MPGMLPSSRFAITGVRMSMSINCPECNARMVVPDEVLGKKIRCKKCDAVVKTKAPVEDEVDDEPRPKKSSGRHSIRSSDDDEPRRKTRRPDDDSDERSRPRRYEDDDDVPRSRSRRRDREADKPKQLQVGALIVLIKGILALVLAIVPCTAPFGGILGILTFLLGILSFVIAKKTQRYKTGIPIAAICVGAAAMLAGGAWTLALNSFFKKVEEKANERREEIANETKVGPALRVTARDLARTIPIGRMGTNSPYYDKIVEITGAVAMISADRPNGPPRVVLDTENREDPAMSCHFPEQARSALAKLAVGSQVTIRGRCSGRIGATIVIEDCTLVSESGGTTASTGTGSAIKKTATELAEEVAGNLDDAKSRYRQKLIQVTGIVSKVETGGGSKEVTVFLEGARGVKLAFTFKPENAASAADLSVGEEVTIKGQCWSVTAREIDFTTCTLIRQ
jgi:DNA-directed RNA polymerase subunit M/transcription elongation factor TFIIS